MSLYEIVDLVPGRHLVVRDLICGGEPTRVDERLGSQTAARWDRMALRVLSISGKPCLAGGALRCEAATPLLEAIDGALIERDGEGLREWTWLRGEARPAVAPLQGETHALSYDSESEDCRWTFARLALKPDALLLTCNSRQRADMAKMKLAGVLDGLIGQPLMSMQTLEQAMADSRAKRSEEDVAAETVPPHRGSVASAVHG